MTSADLHRALSTGVARIAKLAGIARRPSLWRALCHGVAASVEHSRVPFNAHPRTVLDVGASRGQFALFARHRFPHARIICFEPLAEAAAKLRAVLPDERVEVHPVALGREAGTATLHVANEDDSSSLLPIGWRQQNAFGTTEVSQREVEVRALREYLSPSLPRPALLKIDVQGTELDVLDGAGEALSLIDEIYAELSFVELYDGQAVADAVVCRLREGGLAFVGAFNLTRSADGACLQGDFLFRRAFRPAFANA